jgi:hypothetical protein
MNQYLLRLEAVNFATTCYNTNELSTIRGGSMMLANAHELIKGTVPVELGNGPEFFGASHSVWKFDASGEERAQQVAKDLLNALASHPTLRHGTFVCNVQQHNVQSHEDDVRTLQKLRMLNHWGQYQKPTIANPIVDRKNTGNSKYCEFDRIRPATQEINKGEVYQVSQSTFDKRNYGREQKKKFFRSVNESLNVVNDLNELTCHFDPNHRLNGKMAIIYIDGNKQSEVVYTRSIEENNQFRRFLRQSHGDFLRELVAHALESQCVSGESNEWFFWDTQESQHQLRIETLIWGGDDIVLVVPAWKGLFTIERFFCASAKWKYNNEPLTHSAGIVFCNAKTPVQDMVSLADDLVIQCKKRAINGDYKDLIAYEVLESFDNMESNIDAAWSRRMCSDSDCTYGGELVIAPSVLSSIKALIQETQKKIQEPDARISRRKIEMLVREMPQARKIDIDFDKSISSAFDSITSWSAIGDRSERSKLLHLVSLWDYLG